MAKSGGGGGNGSGGTAGGGGCGGLTWVTLFDNQNNASKKEEPGHTNINDSKKLSVERVYQKKTQLEHILLRPDTYIGSVEPLTQLMWVFDEDIGMNCRDVTFVPGLYKIFDEILVNAADNKQRDKNMTCIKISIEPESNIISIWNNGKGIPVVEHKVEKMYVPALIFGQLLTSSNYDDDEKKVTGGRNGYGAKLCNIFSTKFTVETACKEYKHSFKQVNGFRSYVDLYVKDKLDETGLALKIIHELANERWDVCLTLSEKGFQQISFVNSIATTKGGRHVDYVVDQIVGKLIEVVKKKNKAGVSVKPFQVKNHIWVFINCLIENPSFDSQTKENMTLQPKSFGSKCQLSEKFFKAASNCGIVESILNWVKFKAQTQLNKKCSSVKHSKIKGIPKLDDANDAGGKHSLDCTLILTEGDSAKSLAVSGLGVIGRDRYGVFPLRGKMLNVREASHKQIMENAEINNIIKIVGLQYKKSYEDPESLKTLRYGKIMIMTDQDQDGSHIKGLLINFIHHNWPSLLKHGFLEEFITPIVKASKNKQELSFYSIPEFDEWKKHMENHKAWKVKYYKGLGTSTAKEAKEYFADMERHRILFRYAGPEDDAAITLAFSKKKIDDRKEWLTNFMEDRRQRRLHGLPEQFLYGTATKHLTYNDFINKELILFSNSDNERSIPSLVDGFKPGQRKVLFTCCKRNDKREVKVAQLAGSVAEMSAYHHGEQALMMTIVNLAQNFVGSNNVSLLQPIGQFGTRLHGGKDAASPRYIFTMLSPLARLLFPAVDDNLLKFLYDDNQRVEPEWYIPIIPMVLINGAEGIGTGWACKIPNYDTREIVNNVRRMLDGLDPHPMLPNYKNFKGAIQELGQNQYVVSGEIFVVDRNTVEITELPVRTWTQVYKEQVLEPMLNGTEKTPALISDYKEYHTDTTVKFVVKMTEEKLAQAEAAGLHKVFKLQTSLTCNSMVLFDHMGCLKKYETVQDILKEFFDLRLNYYGLRKEWLAGMLGAESTKLNNQARFILEKIQGKIAIENKSKRDLIQMLVQRGYESDPVKAWKEAQEKAAEEEEMQNLNDDHSSSSGSTSGPDFNYILNMSLWWLTKEKVEEIIKQRDTKGKELNDLKRKSSSDLWKEDLAAFIEELEKVEAQEREDVLAGMTSKPIKGKVGKPKMKKLHLEETMPSPFGRKVVPQITSAMKADASKKLLKKKKGDLDTSAIKLEFDEEFGGTPIEGVGEELLNTSGPVIKTPKPKRERKELSTRVRRTPSATKTSAKKVKKRNPWSDDETKSESDLEENDPVIIPRDSLLRRAAAERPKYTFDFSEEEEDDDDEDANNNNSLNELKVKTSPNINDREDDFVPSDSLEKVEYDFSPVKSKPSPEKVSQDKTNQDFDNLFMFPSYSRKANIDTSKFDNDEEDSTSVFSPSFIPKQTETLSSKTVVTKKAKLSSDMPSKVKRSPKPKKMELINSDSESEFGIPKKSIVPKGKSRRAKKRKASGSENEGEYNPGRKEPKSVASKKPKKTAFDQDSDVEIFSSDFASETTSRPRTGRARKEVKYFAESDEDDDFPMF
ncbi:DNA topoisomerase 2-beta isoform X3 [Erythrolamprus reginae]|uniref:DNA topoisomerase 2-beta isoform X3 n=1 Tax=Erythrolamprus reginae TaxID=121349 RepID=UPI00396C89A5